MSHYGNFPDWWSEAPMSELFILNPKNKLSDESLCGFIPMSLVEDGFSGRHYFETRNWGQVKKGFSQFQNGDIGIAKISPCFENLKSVIFEKLPNGNGAGTTELTILRSLGVYSKFYLYLFKSDWYISEGTKYFKGVVGQQRVNKEIFTDLIVPVPPINEQKRIAEEIERCFALVDTLEQNECDLKEAIQKSKSKILDLALSGKLTSDTSHYPQLPDGWEYKQLEEVAIIFDNVRIPLNAKERENRIRNKQSSELYPYYGATGQVGLIDEYLLEGKFLLLGEDGAPFLDKNAIKAYPVEGRFWVNNHAHILKPKYDFDFLVYYLNGLDYKAYVSGSTRLKLTQSSMSKIKILMPPQEEQRQISQILNRIFKVLDSIVVDL